MSLAERLDDKIRDARISLEIWVGSKRMQITDGRAERALNKSTSPELDKLNKRLIYGWGIPWFWYGGRRYNADYYDRQVTPADTGLFWTRGNAATAKSLTNKYGDVISRRVDSYSDEQLTYKTRRFLGIRLPDKILHGSRV